MNFNTPIEDPTIINDLLDYDWIIKDFGVLACDCWEYKILIKPNSPLLSN